MDQTVDGIRPLSQEGGMVVGKWWDDERCDWQRGPLYLQLTYDEPFPDTKRGNADVPGTTSRICNAM